jgi:uncharacterized protein YqjF (DUF2071 family)
MAGAVPEEEVPRPAVHQSWRDMTFLHWRFDPGDIAELLPDGLKPDVRDGTAWVGLTPLSICNFRLPLTPAIPGLSSFPETNLRTYVLGPDGRDGVWFFTLEVDSLATTIAARLGFGAPYRLAGMSVEWHSGDVRYQSRRRTDPGVGHDITARPGSPRQDTDDLDHWLTGRWRAWTTIAGRLADVPVQHQPWPLWGCEVVALEENLFVDVGLPPPHGDPLVHFSPGVDVRLGAPRF